MRMANVELQSNFDRFIELAFVMPADPIVSRSHISNSSSGLISHFTQHGSGDNMMICYPEKLGGEAIHIFGARYRMHQIVYTHKAVKQIEFMVTDVLEKADEYIRIPGAVTTEHPDGLYKMSECYQDMSAMASLKDSVLDLIDNDRRPELASARAILRRIGMRDLYACVGKTSFERCSIVDSMTEDQILHEILGLSVTISQLGSSAVLHDVLRTPYGRLPFEDHSGRIVTHPSLLSTVVREGNEELGMDDEGSNGGVEVLGGHEESQFNNDDTYYDSMPLSQNSESHLSITTADMKVSLSKDDLIIEKVRIFIYIYIYIERPSYMILKYFI